MKLQPKRDENMNMANPVSASLIHIPRPGTHFSPARGSAIAKVIYEIGRVVQNQGVHTSVILKRGVECSYSVGEGRFVPFGDIPRRWQRRMDDRLSAFKAPRFFSSRFMKPAIEAIELDFAGLVIFHDSLEFLHDMKCARPHSKVCVWFHNYKWRHLKPWELQRAFSAAHRIICVSEFVAQALLKDCATLCDDLETKVAVVRNGVDTTRFTPLVGSAAGPTVGSASRDVEPIVISFAGRMIEKKGVHLLLEAAQILAEEVATRNFKLRFIGSKSIQTNEKLSPYERDLRERGQTLGEHVEWVGPISHDAMPAQLASSDIVCVPSLWDDPCPLVTLEALASGCALISTRRGGIPEIGGQAALFFDATDAKSLASVLTSLIGNPTLLSEIKRKSRQRALQLTWEASFQSLYDQVF